MMNSRFLANRYQAAHNEMRNIDGLQPQEALDELLKYVFFKERDELSVEPIQFLLSSSSPETIGRDAQRIRSRFQASISDSDASPMKWADEGILLSDLALVKVHAIFEGLRLNGGTLDLRSAALREFLTGPVRKGLGIFLTPEEIVREIVEAIAPTLMDKIIDPACGSGTFLMEAARFIASDPARSEITVYGTDKNPRMVQLAEFNCGHLKGSQFKRATADALLAFGSEGQPEWYQAGSFDVVLTNPPFGVSIDERAYAFQQYLTCSDGRGGSVGNQGSEIVFIERALQLLKPGGRLGIVLPRSIVTNRRLAEARAALGSVGCVRAVITLPPETFAATGTQTTTVVLIVEKFDADHVETSMISPVIARVENVGFDQTGRSREGTQLPGLGASIRTAMASGVSCGLAQVLSPMPAESSFALLEQMLGENRDQRLVGGRKLGELIELAITGATPPRSAYSASGLFLVKVGNLTGAGINWAARDRNFVDGASLRRYAKVERSLVPGDILLTSSAHVTKYIGKKADIITTIPAEVGGSASFVGEVMLVRAKSEIDPFRLLAYLRSPTVIEALQDRVRGQTAHLHPSDLMDLWFDDDLFSSPIMDEITDILRREADISDELNMLAFKQLELRALLSEQTAFVEMAAE